MSIGKGMLSMIKNFTVEKVFSMAGARVPQSLLPVVNAVLQQIPRPGADVPAEEKTLPANDGAYSVYDEISDLLNNNACKAVLSEPLQMLSEKLGMPVGEGMLSILGGFTVHQLLCAAGDKLPEGLEAETNEKLQAIAKA